METAASRNTGRTIQKMSCRSHPRRDRSAFTNVSLSTANRRIFPLNHVAAWSSLIALMMPNSWPIESFRIQDSSSRGTAKVSCVANQAPGLCRGAPVMIMAPRISRSVNGQKN